MPAGKTEDYTLFYSILFDSKTLISAFFYPSFIQIPMLCIYLFIYL